MYQLSCPRKSLLEELLWFTWHRQQCTSLLICMSSTIRGAPSNFLLAYPHKSSQNSQSSTIHSLLIIIFMFGTFMSLSGCVSFPSINLFFFGSKEIDFQKNILSIYYWSTENQFFIGRKIMTLVAEIGLHFIFHKPFSTSPKTHQPPPPLSASLRHHYSPLVFAIASGRLSLPPSVQLPPVSVTTSFLSHFQRQPNT